MINILKKTMNELLLIYIIILFIFKKNDNYI